MPERARTDLWEPQGSNPLGPPGPELRAYQGTPPPSWVTSYSPNHFANVMYDELSSQGMMADVALAAQRNVGYVYVTDQTLPNPYGELPSYWDQEVAAISAASVPEPGSVTIMASGCMLVAPGIAVRRWVRRRGRPKTP